MSILDALSGGGTAENRVYGVAAGLVTNNHDMDGLGRVKLKFPWLSDANETDWVRIATLMAGGERGSFFLPEVGDEVLVAFEYGDINRPYVIGFLWNGKAKPPEDNSDGKNNIRKITSRSGHEIIFKDDTEGGKERLEIHTSAGHSVLLDDTVGGEKIEVKDSTGSNSILIDSARNAISVQSLTRLTISSASIEISADGNLAISAGGLLKLNGGMVKINC